MRTLFAFLIALVTLAAPAAAQNPARNAEAWAAIPEADPADVESTEAIVHAVYEAISGGAGVDLDWDRFMSLFAPDAMLIPLGRSGPDAPFQPIYMSTEFYRDNIGPRLEEAGFFEVEVHRVEERWGNMAHVFSTYESRRAETDEQPFMRGINSFQLAHDGERWWIVNIFWQSERPDLPIPSEYGG